jgi:hypothetical protein
VAVKVAAKAGKLGKAAKLLKKITETIKRTAGRHQVLERNLEGGGGTTARTGSVARKGGIPEVESPKKKPDETVVNEYNALGEGVASKKTSEAPKEAYNRRKHYGSSPTKSDRKAFDAGANDVVDHDPPLVKRYYEGDPAKGEPPGYKMTNEQRKANAADRSRMQLQDKADSHKQGGQMSNYSKQKKKEHGL